MRGPVFVSGDFSSGTTLLFTLFRRTGDFHCLYEPLHQKLLEYLVYPLRIDEDHHVNAEPYFREYKGFREIPHLFDPAFGVRRLHLGPDDDAPELERYLAYLLASASAHGRRPLLKENRFPFRLGWLRARFPEARIVHVYRDKDAQWRSIVRRGQEHVGREDIGQDSPHFAGFNVSLWCEDLKTVYPELDASKSGSGYERFSKLWDLSFAEQSRNADVSVGLQDLVHELDATLNRIGEAIDYSFEIPKLRPIVARPEQRNRGGSRPSLTFALMDAVGGRYAKARVALRFLLRGDASAARAVIAGHPGQSSR